MVELLAELRTAAFAVRQPHLDRIKALGVSSAWIAHRPTHPFGIVNAEASGGGLYQPGAGEPHLVLPVIEDGVLVDLVAFRSIDPGNWMLRTGNGWALGLERGIGWHGWCDTVHLFSDPLDWMQGQGDGIAVLDWGSPEVHRLDVLPRVACSDHTTASLLEGALTRPQRLPEIEVQGGLSHVA